MAASHSTDSHAGTQADTSANTQEVTSNVITFPELTNFRKKHVKQFIIAHLNVNSYRKKFYEMQDIFENNLCDMLLLSETKIDASFPDNQFYMNDFKLYRQDRDEHGGGLLCYIRSDISHRRRDDLEYNENGIESLLVEVIFDKIKMFVICIYRPPNIQVSHLCYAIEQMSAKCLCEGQFLILIGDLNVNFNEKHHELCDIMDIYSLKDVIKGATCFKNCENPTKLDVILTNKPRSLAGTLNTDIGVSDFHNMICVASKAYVPHNVKRTITYRSYKNFNENAYVNSLASAPFQLCDIFDDANDKLWVHNKLLEDVIEQHAPKKIKRVRGKPSPYMNNELRRAINAKAMLRRKHRRDKTTEAWNRYKTQRTKVNKLKRQSIKIYFEKHCNNITKDTTNFWSSVKPYFTDKSSKSCQNIVLFENDKIVNDQTQVANIFNDHFIDIADHLSEPEIVKEMSISEIKNYYISHPSILEINNQMSNRNRNFSLNKVSIEKVYQKFKMLDIKKANGYDFIPGKLLKSGAEILCNTFTPIINASISHNVFPDCLKYAEVSPIHKKKDILDKKNYRPVSVLTSLSKIMESIVCDQINDYFNSILSDLLSAYRKNFSCENVLFKCLEEWKLALDNNETVACIAMDLSKAFDCLPYGLLLAKMSAYGVSDDGCKFFQSYLESRMQRVKVGSNRSKWLTLKRGVPQGSLTGPILFNIFINDLMYSIDNRVSLFNYADDNTLSYHNKDVGNVKSVLQNETISAIKWFKINNMEANSSKFQAMVMSRNLNCQIEFTINGVEIPCSDHIKLLGVDFDKKLNFDIHVTNLCKKAGRRLNAMSRLANSLCIDSMIKIFDAFIKSSFNYCTNIWHLCNKRSSRKIEKLQERALRLIYTDYNISYDELLDLSKRNTMYEYRVKNLLVTIRKIINGKMKPVSKEFYTFKDNNYRLRNTNCFDRPNVNAVNYGINSLRYQGIVVWDKLPNTLKNETDINEFKKKVKMLQL